MEALHADSLILVEGTGQTGLGSNYGDGFATDSRVQARHSDCRGIKGVYLARDPAALQ